MRPYEIRTYIREKFPKIYSGLFTVFIPFFSLWRNYKVSRFKKKVVHVAKYGNHKFSIWLDPKNGLVDRSIFIGDVYEPHILAKIDKYLPKGGFFVDIGANIGQHTLFAASVVGEGGKVVAFEPVSFLADQLYDSVKLNGFEGRVSLVRKACGDEVLVSNISLKKDNLGGSSLVATTENAETEEVEVCIPDDLLLGEKRKVDMIKIDTEGYEFEVVKGLKNTIEKDKPAIILEYSPTLWGDRGLDVGLLMLSYFESLSYQIIDVDHGDFVIDDVKKWVKDFSYQQANLLLLPK
ncbi:MAG: FkbM family methyltransferase [Candidatus Nomurabacteria bacterium]|nr:FkbM family methyltransferase [Candidatus Nomurabacteria bacterium]USN88131.1 MAG: FkbM family methyltransferase [Candidatus Nomurabacteria bacterium]